MVDLILFMGQSNMQGQTEKLLEPNPIIKGGYEYKFFTNELKELRNPVGENVGIDFKIGKEFKRGGDCDKWAKEHLLGSSCFGNTNMVPAFCNEYIKNTNREVVAVHTAKGSTTVKQWLNGGAIYQAVKNKVFGAINKIGENNISNRFVIWLQGESDAIFNTDKEEYKNSLRALKNSLKADFKIDKFFIIKVGAFTNDYKDEVIFEAQEEICNEEDFVMLTRITKEIITNSKYLNEEYAGHYNALGQELIGKRAGKNLANYVNGEDIAKWEY